MRAKNIGFVILVSATAAACDREPIEEYPSADEVPVTVPAAETPGGQTIGVDTVLDPVIPPPPGTTPP